MITSILLILVCGLALAALPHEYFYPDPQVGERSEIFDWTAKQRGSNGFAREFSWNRRKLYVKRPLAYVRIIYACLFIFLMAMAYKSVEAIYFEGANIEVVVFISGVGFSILVFIFLKFREEPQECYFDLEKKCYVFSGIFINFSEIVALQILEKQVKGRSRYHSLYELNIVAKDSVRIHVIQIYNIKIMEHYVSQIADFTSRDIVRNYSG